MICSNRVVWTLGVLFLVLLLSACGDQVPATKSMPEPTATEPASSPEPAAPVPSPTAPSTEVVMTSQSAIPSPPDPGLEPLIEQAKEDLAQMLSLAVDQIEVLEAKLVLWPDASRGCPQPGMRYKQVPEEGVLIRLSAGGRVYDYHSGGKDGLFLCEQRLQAPELTPKPGSHGQLPPPSSLDD